MQNFYCKIFKTIGLNKYTDLYTDMAKTIMIGDEVYSALTKLKRPNESYTKLLSRLTGISKDSSKDIMSYAGLWSNVSEKNAQERFKDITQLRKNWRKTEW
jgi:predicted CopG family antitoxin